MKTVNVAAALGCLLAFATPAMAHITLEVSEAAVGGGYKAVFRVPHGCKGSPTTKVRIQIPEGVIAVKPQPKAGWTLDIVKGKYAKTYKVYGHDVSEGAKEITWTGNLPDDYYDEFVLNAFLAADLPAETTMYFPVVQECAEGVERWIEVPAEGQEGELRFPAPTLRLLKNDEAAHD